MNIVSGYQADIAAIAKRRAGAAPPGGEAVTPAHAADQAATSGARAADRAQVPSVSEQEWAGLSPADRGRLEQAGIVFDSRNGVMADAGTGLQVSWAEARSVLDRPRVGKGYQDRGATPGPGQGLQPGRIEPGDFQRGYIHPDHAAPSPMHQPPRDFPVPEGQPSAEDFTRGYLQPGHAAASPAVRDSGMPQHQLSALPQVHGSGPAAAGIAAHMARYSMTSPSLRGGKQT